MAGTGKFDREAIDYTRHAKKPAPTPPCVPYYNKPTQEGSMHYKAVNDAVDLPQVIYILGVRSSICRSRPWRVVPSCRMSLGSRTHAFGAPMKTRLAIDADFTQLSGEDASVVPYLAQGGHGCISVTANVAPRPLRNA